jgi:hypothetical protein
MRIARIVPTVIAACAVQLAAAPALAQKAEGEIANIVGKGEHRRGQAGAWVPARVKQPVFPLDWVQTLDMSRMVLRFGDGSTENLGPNSQFHVIKVGTPSDPKTILELNRGRMWGNSKTAPGGLEIRTGSARSRVSARTCARREAILRKRSL